MEAYKQFKDPIYEYINVNTQLVSDIIDTPAFQRLKDIRQTSYTPLYPAAYHNRYIHSLGVYHLGRIAFGSIRPQLLAETLKSQLPDIDRIQELFELACLLHDIGHAPFSHTGETFYIDKTYTLYDHLKKSVNNNDFSADFDKLDTKKPAPHECMSCIVGIETFPNYFKSDFERSFFARCIIGMPISFNETHPDYNTNLSDEQKRIVTKAINEYNSKKTRTQLLNCIISLLNSSIIDVDRLDYIIRDAATIGFKNTQVDYIRLLTGMRIIEYNKTLCVGYHKSALSVLESAIYAHDAEKKWVQGHPSILYEMEALKNAMAYLTNLFATDTDPNPLFCYDALTEQGKLLHLDFPILSQKAYDLISHNNFLSPDAKKLADNHELLETNNVFDFNTLSIRFDYPVLLLADEDILYLIKRFCKSEFGFEYFARNRRRLAVWKSEAEFRALFQERIGDKSTSIKTLESNFEDLMDYCQDKTGAPIVTREILSILDTEEKDTIHSKENKEIPDDIYEDLINGIKSKRHWVTVLVDLALELDIHPEFLIIFQKKFSSSFKASIGQIPILFPNIENGITPLENVVNILQSSQDHKSNFFHLYYKPKNTIDRSTKKKIVNKIAKTLIKAIND